MSRLPRNSIRFSPPLQKSVSKLQPRGLRIREPKNSLQEKNSRIQTRLT